jgi:hypothetical protein
MNLSYLSFVHRDYPKIAFIAFACLALALGAGLGKSVMTRPCHAFILIDFTASAAVQMD